MTSEQAWKIHEANDARFEAAIAAYRVAERALKRSKSRKNAEAFHIADEALDVIARECRESKERAQILERREMREARVEARKVMTPDQLALF